jgi:hypothetical protein
MVVSNTLVLVKVLKSTVPSSQMSHVLEPETLGGTATLHIGIEVTCDVPSVLFVGRVSPVSGGAQFLPWVQHAEERRGCHSFFQCRDSHSTFRNNL